jgi:6-phosphofructokinase 1
MSRSRAASVTLLYDDIPTFREVLQPLDSPFLSDNYWGGGFKDDNDILPPLESANQCPFPVLRGGPRKTIYYSPEETVVAILNSGGLCPGINDIIRSIVLKLIQYGVQEKNILGVINGFQGFYNRATPPITLTKALVESVHLEGGSCIGTNISQDETLNIAKAVAKLDLMGVDQLYIIGGLGTLRAASELHQACLAKGVTVGIVTIPASVENNIPLIDKSFGFDTAVEEAQQALLAGKVEASSAYRGVGIVKMMGKASGFLAVQSSLASGLVDICLIPEMKFSLQKVADYVENLLQHQGHVVICISEGACQDWMDGSMHNDAAGNPMLGDIGGWLKSRLKRLLKDVDIKLIEPNLLIRSVPSNATDRVLTRLLGHAACHALFSGFTGVSVCSINTHLCILAQEHLMKGPRRVTHSAWGRLKSAVGQPALEEEVGLNDAL